MSMKLKHLKGVPVEALSGIKVYLNGKLIYNSYPETSLDVEKLEYPYWDYVIENIAVIDNCLVIYIKR